MKSGTSTLASHLSAHESVHMPRREVHFFDDDEYYSRGLSWYMEELMKEWPDEFSRPKLIGEKTPTYSYREPCPERIQSSVPGVKLVWIFRDPVKRAFSNYLHERAKGTELRSFNHAVENEYARRVVDYKKGYVDRSKYVKQVEMYMKHFPLSQMYFMVFEDLVEDAEGQMNDLCKFLGIRPFAGELPLIQSNPTKMPLCPESLWLTRKLLGLGETTYRVVRKDSYFYKKVRNANMRFYREKPKMDPGMKNRLGHLFRPYNARLANLTGLDLAKWMS